MRTPALLGGAKHNLVKAFKSNDRAALDRAVEMIQRAIDGISPGDRDYWWCQFYLNLALRLRFERTGNRADLDRAIAVGREAAAAATDNHQADAALLGNLGTALQNRFDAAGDLQDLDAAIDVYARAAATPRLKRTGRIAVLSNFASGLRVRSEWTGKTEDLDYAIQLGRALLADRGVRNSERGAILANLGDALRLRGQLAHNVGDLDAAIDAVRQAVTATKAGHSQRAIRLNGLTVALRLRYQQAGRPEDLTAAIASARSALAASPPDNPVRALYLSNLGSVLRMHFEQSGSVSDLDEATAVGQEAVAIGDASIRVRAVAARGWGNAAALGQRWPEAVTAYARAIELMGRLAPRGANRSDQERLLDNLSGVGADAAACCVRTGQNVRAVELFEQGRGVLLGQALDVRTDITTLASRHGDLARQFIALRNELAERAHEGQEQAGADEIDGSLALGLEAERRRTTAEAFDQVVDKIRELPEFERFLRPPVISELTSAAAGGPVVLVNVSDFGSCALILTPEGVQEPEPLPALDPAAVLDHVRAFLDEIDKPSSAAGEKRLAEHLRWLWDAVAGPVLSRLAIDRPPPEGAPWPRMWWCVSGLLSLLPLHSAGHYEDRQQDAPATVPDRVVSSYTPTIRALTHARRARPSGEDAPAASAGAGLQIVAVAMPSTPGEKDLPAAEGETAGLLARFPGRVTVLEAEDATYESVVAALPGADWVHFACHGFSDLARPSDSSLLLHDHRERPLTVPDIGQLDLVHADLAVLSACSTARPGGRLADEAIHLASAFQLAGYRHVVGTLWPIGDRQAEDVAEDFYAALAGGADVAAAIHSVTRRMSRRWFDRPSAWASHVHVGA